MYICDLSPTQWTIFEVVAINEMSKEDTWMKRVEFKEGTSENHHHIKKESQRKQSQHRRLGRKKEGEKTESMRNGGEQQHWQKERVVGCGMEGLERAW